MINKNINGTNKTNRTINKLKKYLGIETKLDSNKYLKITKLNKAVFKVAPEICKEVSNDFLVINPQNSKKPFFTKKWATIMIDNMVAWAPYKQEDIEKLERLSKGFDDVEKVKIGNRILKKNAFN